MKNSNIFPRHTNYEIPTSAYGEGCYIFEMEKNILMGRVELQCHV